MPPVPGLAALREAYSDEAPATGYVNEGPVGRTGGIETTATFWTVEADSMHATRTVVVLDADALSEPVYLTFQGDPAGLQPGVGPGVSASYLGLGGYGPAAITARTDSRLSGVFAASVSNASASLEILRVYRTVHGGFNAVRVAAPE